MALIERLIHRFEPDQIRHISAHSFFAAMNEIIAGRLTVAGVKTFLSMTAADSSEFDALIAKTPGTAVGKAQYVNDVHSIFILANAVFRNQPGVIGAPGYQTPAEVRTKLGI